MSRADLARGTGLSRTTVSSLVADLIAGGHVVETTDRGRPHKGGSGRPPLLVTLSAPPGGVAGVDIGHGHVRVAVADRTGAVLAEELGSSTSTPTGRRRSTGADWCAAPWGGRRGRGRPAPRRHVRARAAGPPLGPDQHRHPAGLARPGPRRGAQPRLGVPVVADNDANLGALAELHHGVARGVTDVVYVKVASGLGAGIVLGGRLHRGATGIAGEIGHVQVGEDGQVCRCGNRGCLETVVAAPGCSACCSRRTTSR